MVQKKILYQGSRTAIEYAVRYTKNDEDKSVISLHSQFGKKPNGRSLFKKMGSAPYEVESAGLEAGNLNPFAVAVMKEEGIAISGNQTNSVFDFFKQGKRYRYAITICDKEASERCLLFPGMSEKTNWSFPDPSAFTGTDKEKPEATRKVRKLIKKAVQDFVKQLEK